VEENVMAHRMKLALLLTPVALIGASALAAPVHESGKKVTASLSGANEVPPTTETATGTAVIWVNQGQRRICWDITTTGFSGADSITAAHIHQGQAGTNGGIVVFLAATLNASNKGCTSIVGGGNNTPLSDGLYDSIRKSPQAFYVNVHTVEFPGGAIRGQLG